MTRQREVAHLGRLIAKKYLRPVLGHSYFGAVEGPPSDVSQKRMASKTHPSALVPVPSPKAYLERGRFAQPGRGGKPAWAHPVIANGRLYLRDQDLLLAYDIRAR